jgi:membrane protein required for colicin V production
MNWVDYVFVGIILLSLLIGIFRGLVREALSLVIWVFAFALTLRYASAAAEHLDHAIKTPAVRNIAAYALVFFGVLIVGAVIIRTIATAVKGVGLGGIDCLLGGGFGLVRGVFLVAAIVMVAGASEAKQEHWWNESTLVPQFEPLAQSLQGLTPDHWLAYLRPKSDHADAKSESSKLRPEH